MFAVAGLFAEECVMQGHADYVQDIVDAVTDFIGAHMLQWLVSQGGWVCFISVSKKSHLTTATEKQICPQ